MPCLLYVTGCMYAICYCPTLADPAQRPSVARRRLQDENMPVDDAPLDEDDRIRQTYNFAPSYHGLVYRADTSDSGAGGSRQDADTPDEPHHSSKSASVSGESAAAAPVDGSATKETKYKLQAMKWGLVPFWTKRAPDYGSQLKTINCRDDSLAQSGGMWNTMKQKKRCVVIAEGFYEWLKKNNGRDKIPHFVKRKDGQLMCFAGLWDCVKYDGQDDQLWTYTVITTSSNKQLNFLHDRMPVILDNGSDAMKTWLDPTRYTWSKELQTLLKPFDGELECYPVDRAVGKVGNNSPSFIVPIDSKENKKNIANFFSIPAKEPTMNKVLPKDKDRVKAEDAPIKQEPGETRVTANISSTEDNAPLPIPTNLSSSQDQDLARGVKRELPDSQDLADVDSPPPAKVQKPSSTPVKNEHENGGSDEPHLKSPEKAQTSSRKTRSALSNASAGKTSNKPGDGTQKITAFFAK